MARRIGFGLVLLLAGGGFWAAANPPFPVVGCPCDHADAASLDGRVCSLCRTAEEQTEPVYFLKDISPSKPNRYLALPRHHGSGLQSLEDLDDAEREAVWTAAIRRAEELFGPRWGLAHNSYFFRTQCHAHIHMGPLSPEVEDVGGELFANPAEFPKPAGSQGVWLHPKSGQYCLHLDRDLAEVVLIR